MALRFEPFTIKPLFLMLIKVSDKWDEVRLLINLWLKEQKYYCNWCGKDYTVGVACCDNPQIGRNIDHARGIIKQNKELKATRKNVHASTDDKTIRLGVSMPPALYTYLDRFFRSYKQSKLFDNPSDLHSFMKRFPMFTIPQEV